MPLELGAFCPQPGGTGHFMGEGGIEAAARRGLERRNREAAEAERKRNHEKDAVDQTFDATTDNLTVFESEEKSSKDTNRDRYSEAGVTTTLAEHQHSASK